jgi:hypothetical protein
MDSYISRQLHKTIRQSGKIIRNSRQSGNWNIKTNLHNLQQSDKTISHTDMDLYNLQKLDKAIHNTEIDMQYTNQLLYNTNIALYNIPPFQPERYTEKYKLKEQIENNLYNMHMYLQHLI